MRGYIRIFLEHSTENLTTNFRITLLYLFHPYMYMDTPIESLMVSKWRTAIFRSRATGAATTAASSTAFKI